MLLSYSLNLEKVKLPPVSVSLTIQPSYILKKKANAKVCVQELNTKQREVFEIVLSAVYNNQTNSNKCFFFILEVPAGTGKNFLYTTLLHTICGKGDLVRHLASTSITATLLSRDRTAHSVF